MAQIIKPPEAMKLVSDRPSLFLAGSIEMGTAIDWQLVCETALKDYPIIIFNPRRDNWDASWEQTIDNPIFREQVEWELAAQEQADIIACYFAPQTKAPITLLELGLAARSGKLIVCCPDGFWRKGNVDIVCQRFGIETTTNLDQLIAAIKQRLQNKFNIYL